MVKGSGLLVTRKEHRKRNSFNELRFGCERAIFMPSAIRLRAARLRRDMSASGAPVRLRRDKVKSELVTGGE